MGVETAAAAAVQEVGCEVAKCDTQPCSCSEHKMIERETMRQSYACAMLSFDTEHPDTFFLCLIILAVPMYGKN